MSSGVPLISDDAPEVELPEVELPESEPTGPERRCLVTGHVLPKGNLLRFSIDPQGVLVPDIAEKLPGRGLWITADRATLGAALKKNVFSRAARRAVRVPPDCAQRVVDLLRQRMVEAIGFARRSGTATSGFEKVEGWARAKRLQALLVASDAGKDGRGKLEALSPGTHIIDVLDSRVLGGIFGTIGIVVYAGISDKAHAARVISLGDKLKALTAPVHDVTE